MANGDIGARLESWNIFTAGEAGNLRPGNHVVRLTGNIFAAIYGTEDGNQLIVRTYSVNLTTGLQTSIAGPTVIKTISYEGSSFLNQGIMIAKVTNGIWAASYVQRIASVDYLSVTTFSLSDAGVIGTEIATAGSLASSSIIWRGPVFHKVGNYFTSVYLTSTWVLTCASISISSDGLTISLVNSLGTGTANVTYINGSLSGYPLNDKFCVSCEGSASSVGGSYATVWEINQTSGTVSIASNYSFATGISLGGASLAYVAGSTWIISYTTGGHTYVSSFTINPESGAIGAVINTATDLDGVNSYIWLGSCYNGIVTGSHVYGSALGYQVRVMTFTCSSAGIVGTSVIDSANVNLWGGGNPSYDPLWWFRISSTVYHVFQGSYYSARHNLYLLTWSEEVSDAPEGTSTEARVGSIRHLYRPGFYKMEITLGGLVRGIDIPEGYEITSRLSTKPVPDIPEAPEPFIGPVLIQGLGFGADPGRSVQQQLQSTGIKLPERVAAEIGKAILTDMSPLAGQVLGVVQDVSTVYSWYRTIRSLTRRISNWFGGD